MPSRRGFLSGLLALPLFSGFSGLRKIPPTAPVPTAQRFAIGEKEFRVVRASDRGWHKGDKIAGADHMFIGIACGNVAPLHYGMVQTCGLVELSVLHYEYKIEDVYGKA